MKKAFSICFAKLKQTFLGSLRMQSSYSCHWTAEGAAGACPWEVFTSEITVNLTSCLLLMQLCQHSQRGLVWW